MANLPTNRSTANSAAEHVADHNELHSGHNLNEAARHNRQHSVTSTSDHTFPGGTTNFLREDGTWAAPSGGGGSAPTFVRKTADESVTSSTTLQNDDHLLLALAANETWTFEGILFVRAAGLTVGGQFKAAFTVPTGAALVWGGPGMDTSGSTAGVGDGKWEAVNASGTAIAFGITNSSRIAVVQFRGIVRNGANAGNLQLQWAQNASNADATTVLTDSYLIAHKVT